MRREKIRQLVLAALFLAMAALVQSWHLPQLITGVVINAILLLACQMVSLKWSVAIGMMTPVLALMLGILPSVMLLAVPFIAVANAIYIVLFRRFLSVQMPGNIMAIGLSSLAKFFWLFFAVNVVLDLPPEPSAMLSFPQLFTGIAGGILALLLIRTMERWHKDKK